MVYCLNEDEDLKLIIAEDRDRSDRRLCQLCMNRVNCLFGKEEINGSEAGRK